MTDNLMLVDTTIHDGKVYHVFRNNDVKQVTKIDANYEEIFKTIEERDYQDTHRETSPLCKADDAIELDTSNMNIEEVVSSIESLIAQKVRKEDL